MQWEFGGQGNFFLYRQASIRQFSHIIHGTLYTVKVFPNLMTQLCLKLIYKQSYPSITKGISFLLSPSIPFVTVMLSMRMESYTTNCKTQYTIILKVWKMKIDSYLGKSSRHLWSLTLFLAIWRLNSSSYLSFLTWSVRLKVKAPLKFYPSY